MDCGVACLAMICWFYGERPNLNQIRQLCGTNIQGTSLFALAEAGERLGFLTRGIKASADSLELLNLPAICYWNNNHYVVLYEIDKQRAIIGDPGSAILTIDREQFSRLYSGVALEMVPTEKALIGVKHSNPMTMLIPLSIKFRDKIRDVFLASLASQILLLIQPVFSQIIIDKVIVHQNTSMLNAVIIGMLILSLIQTAVSYLRAFLLSYVTMRIDQELMVNFYRHLLSLPFRFFQERTTADIISRFEQNRTITSFLTGPGVTVVLDAMTFSLCLCILFWYNLKYASACIVFLLLYSVLIAATRPWLKQLNRLAIEKNTKVQSHLIETVRAIESVKAGAAENERRWGWERLFLETQTVGFNLVLASGLIGVFARFISLFGELLLLWLGATLVIEEQVSIGQLVALQMIVARLSQSVLGLVSVWDQIQNVQVSMERLGDVLETTAEEPQPKSKIPMPTVSGHIVFDKVTFTYSDMTRTDTLSNISFEARPGEMIGIVGRSGAGKTTLIRLLQGLYSPTSGLISIDGKNLSHVSLPDLRRQIGVVSQSEHFFSGTILENLTLLAPEATMEQVLEAATISGINHFIQMLPKGYQTQLGEDGYNLSGGQRQRLAIARTLVKKPRILIFDEATSSLDAESEHHIQNAIEELRRDTTMFVIAHRLSTVTKVDRLLVMDHGEIVEIGSHKELLDQRGVYFNLYNQQLACSL